MAKLYSSLNTNRNGRRNWRMRGSGEQVHRLGDSFVAAMVKDWEHALYVSLNADGTCEITTRAVGSGNPSHVIYDGPLADLYQFGMRLARPSTPAPVTVVEETDLDRDVQQFLKESA